MLRISPSFFIPLRLLGLIFLLLGYTVDAIQAQSIDLYRRISDPLAIANFSLPDSMPLRHSMYVGVGGAEDTDGFRYFANVEDGPGVISVIWSTQEIPDTVGLLRFTLDDSLIFEGTLPQFFQGQRGRLRSPLDTTHSWGQICYVQMPFKRNFKFTYKGDEVTCWVVAWRPLTETQAGAFRPFSNEGISEQVRAETIVQQNDPWKYARTSTLVNGEFTVPAQDTVTPLDHVGSGVLTDLTFRPLDFDTMRYRHVHLQLYWDGNPTPAVDVPLADLFMAVTGLKQIDGVAIRTTAGGEWQCRFPMPFRRQATLKLVNRNAEACSLAISVSHLTDPPPLGNYGYLHAQFNETLDPRVYHSLPVATIRGRGRYVGTIFNLPEHPVPFFMEGDPFATVDSTSVQQLHYPGTEDYFTGGWYYVDGPFSRPFAGCPEKFTTMYRFHYLDALDLHRSLDFTWQHGKADDYRAWYRTIALYYHRTPSFWINRDTVQRGQTLMIGGRTDANRTKDIVLGTMRTTATADNLGAYEARIVVDASLTVGTHSLQVGQEFYPEPITVVLAPTVTWLVDSTRPELGYLDSIEVSLYGFDPDERIDLLLDTILLASEVQVGANGQLHAKFMVPWSDSGLVTLYAVGQRHTVAATRKVQLTRALHYEMEEQMPPIRADGYIEASYMGWWSYEFWSGGSIVFMDPEGDGKRYSFNFSVPYAGTFQLKMVTAEGLRYGDFEVDIDGHYLGKISAFRNEPFSRPFHSPLHELDSLTLTRGLHVLTFTSAGRHPDAVANAIGPDYFRLVRLGPHRPLKVNASPRGVPEIGIDFDPIASTIGVRLPDHSAGVLELWDILGRKIMVLHEGLLHDGDRVRTPQGPPRSVYIVVLRSEGAIVVTRLLSLP